VEESLRASPAAEHARVRREVLNPILEQLILTRLQAQRARELGIQVSPEEVDAAIASVREENRLSEEQFERALQEQGLSPEEYRGVIEDQIRLSKLVQRDIRAKVTVTDEEAAAWYEEHRQEWSRPEKIRIRHLLVPVAAGAPSADVEAAREKALSLLAQARASGDFIALVRAGTPGASPAEDPVSGEIARGELHPALEAAAFALAEGAISEPVRSPAGFHLVQLVERTPGAEPTLAEVRASIEQKIGERKTRARFEEWLKKLRADAIVEIRY
jgi:peptidyl-prolyl cis-trans isomerase SurA